VNGHQVHLYMPDEMVAALDTEAIRRDISRAALIREACAEKLASRPKKGGSKKSKKKA
jgi:metal-responsive CopG/Arc/MetJ family transcriptional regulator